MPARRYGLNPNVEYYADVEVNDAGLLVPSNPMYLTPDTLSFAEGSHDPVRSVDILFKAVVADELPSGFPAVDADFGFDQCQTLGAKVMLFGLYRGVYLGAHMLYGYPDRVMENMYVASQKGKLEPFIHDFYAKTGTSGYYEWLSTGGMDVFKSLRVPRPSWHCCSWCTTPNAAYRCSKCKAAFYCDKNHQKNQWSAQKRYCQAPM